MPTSYTSLLGFALPATGELSGTWGTTVNNSITELVEDSIAATATASVTSGNWTLSTTGSGAANEARCAILIPTGTPGVSRNIIAPSQSKAYVVINQSDAAVVLKGAATTGATLAAGEKAVVAWNGSDFATVASSVFAGVLPVANGGTGATTLTDGSVLFGNGTGAIEASTLLTQSAAVTSGTYVKSIGYADTVVALGNTGTAINLDVVSGGVFTATLTGNATITLRYPVSSGASSFTLILTNDGTAGRTVAWAGGSFLFPGGAASLSRTTAANAVDVWVFFTPNGGTTYYGNIAMKDMKA